MQNDHALSDRDESRENLADLLRGALPVADDLDDETRRLMLHLSIEPIAKQLPAELSPARAPDRSLIRRVLGKKTP